MPSTARRALERWRGRVPLPNRWELGELAVQAACFPCLVLPWWAAVPYCRLWARLLLRPGGKYRVLMSERLPGYLAPGGQPAHRGEALRESETQMLFQRSVVLRGAVFPSWKRPVRLTGLEHLRDAVQAGRGVILWVHPCLASGVAVKQALAEAGYPLAHLTRPSHGFSGHAFGVRFANPFFRRAEDRFLAERVMIAEGRTIAPLRRLQALLAEGRVVSITVTDAASRLNELPMLGGLVVLPAGPVELAAKTGAALLPVFTAGTGRLPAVEIGAPLPVGGGGTAAVRQTHEATAAWLQERVERNPMAWIGWRSRLFRNTEGSSLF